MNPISLLLLFDWSIAALQDYLSHTTPVAALISIFLVSLYIFYQMYKLLTRPQSKYFYEGDLNAANQYHGYGELTKENEDKYRGQFSNGQFHGEGMYIYHSSNCYYKGQFVEGQFEGKGRETYPDGSVYGGEFKQGLRHGQGKMEYGNGGIYEGGWYRGKKHGEGRVKENNSGSWKKRRWQHGKLEKQPNNDNENSNNEQKSSETDNSDNSPSTTSSITNTSLSAADSDPQTDKEPAPRKRTKGRGPKI